MLSSLLELGSRWTLVGGKGGVGKSTVAAALAVELAGEGERVLVLSLDPAHSLGDALGCPLSAEPGEVAAVPGLEAMEVDPQHERERFLASHRGHLLSLIDRGTYLYETEAAGFVDLTLPGMDELAGLLRLLELAADTGRRVVLDTAPTGHTLRLLDLPRLARGWLDALEAMESKHATVATALAGAYRPDEAAEMLATLRAELDSLDALLTDPLRTRFVLVTTPEPVVVAETLRYREALERRGVAIAGAVVNRVSGGMDPDAAGGGMVFVPTIAPAPVGVPGLRLFANAAKAEPAPPPTALAAGAGIRRGEPFRPPLDRSLYIVGGKGGVGKSTVAAALAIWLAERADRPVHLLSTDPAGSLGDVLGSPVAEEARPVEGVPKLRAQQLDAERIWLQFREEYRRETERLFERLLGGLSSAADREVVERLIDLAPPGLDELTALIEVAEHGGEERGDILVLDSAPTGHLLRLLEMPALATRWVHELLRLLLRYRDVVGLGGMAERVLRLGRQLRSLREELSDPARTWFLAVSRPEALAVPESERLLRRLDELAIPVGALLVNRFGSEADSAAERHAAALVALAGPRVAAAAPELEHGPIGAAELRDFLASWRTIASR